MREARSPPYSPGVEDVPPAPWLETDRVCRFPRGSFDVWMSPVVEPGNQRRTNVRVMVIVKATRESEAGIQPGDEKMLREMSAYNEELIKAGIMLIRIAE